MAELPEPPTPATLGVARQLAKQHAIDIERTQGDIEEAEAQLADLIASTRRAIDTMVQRKSALEEKLLQTKAYLSPMRRLPAEMLREIFFWVFEEDSRVAWDLSAVCQSWRAMALGMPRLWSKIHFSTTQLASADIVRLWLERARNHPLDIEIYIDSSTTSVPPPTPNIWVPFHGGWVAAQPAPAPSSHPAGLHWAHVVTHYLVQSMARWRRFVLRFDRHFPTMDALQSISGDAPLLEEFEICTADTAYFPEWRSFLPCSQRVVNLTRLRSVTLHHISFGLMGPLLVKPPVPDAPGVLSSLTSITLRALPGMVIPLNQVLALVIANPMLEALVLYFPAIQPPVLPLSSYPLITLPHLRTLALGGRPILMHLADKLATPALRSFAWDIDARGPERVSLRHVLQRLLKRSDPESGSSIEELAVNWGFPYPVSHPFRPPPSAAPEDLALSPYASPPLIGGLRRLLRLVPNLRTLSLAEVPLDLVFGVLGGFGDADMDSASNPNSADSDDDEDAAMVATSFTGWTSPTWAAPASDDGAGVNGYGGSGPQVGGAYVCPRLVRLALRCCSSVHVQEALRRMVGFVQGRNPARAGGAGAWMGLLMGRPRSGRRAGFLPHRQARAARGAGDGRVHQDRARYRALAGEQDPQHSVPVERAVIQGRDSVFAVLAL
ncbi:hypothetical protein GGF50DRAFT_107985, partial [Schizophyllum commune]